MSEVLMITNSEGGLCSQMTVALLEIVAFINEHGYFPKVDRSAQFCHHKNPPYNPKQDLSSFFFTELELDAIVPNLKLFNYDCMSVQWACYAQMNFKQIGPIIDRYFNHSREVGEKINHLVSNELDEVVPDGYDFPRTSYASVIYRGNDKAKETKVAPYEDFINKGKEIKARRPEVKFIVLPDECSFKEAWLKEFPDSIFFPQISCTDNRNSMPMFETPIPQRAERDAWFLSGLFLCSQCSELITHSGNVGLWSALYRGHGEGIHQWYNGEWYV